jgi:xylulokinase
VTSGITVGIDIGTTSVKALAVDGDGRVLARARVPHDLHCPSVDVFEHDAKQAWVDGPRQALRQLEVGAVDGIAIASLVPSCTAVDDAGIPITPGLLYGDHRGHAGRNEADLLNSHEIRSMFEWTIAHAPGARGYWTAPAVAGVALGGVPAADLGTGFALAPLWNGDWQEDELAALGARPDQMPVLVGEDEPAGRIGEAVQTASIADAWAECTVAGADSETDALVICGTTLIVWPVVAEAFPVPGMWTIPHPHGGLSIIGGASNAGAMFLNWARRLLAGDAPPHSEPGGVPLWVPYLKGERTPVHDTSLRASLHRMDIGQGPAALLRAAYEASAFTARRLIQLSTAKVDRIVASGGGVHDPQWMQALADCTRLPVQCVAVPEGAALGAAWHARVVAGLDARADSTRWVRFGQCYEPDPRWTEACDERYQRWLELAAFG